MLTHWGRVTHTCVGNLNIIGSDNGLSPGRRQSIISTNTGILFIRSFGTNFSEILGEILTFSFKKIHLKTSSAKWRPSCLCLNVLMLHWLCMQSEVGTRNQTSFTATQWDQTQTVWHTPIESTCIKPSRSVYAPHCPACRTSLIATRFWVVVICPIIKCLTVLEFSFILFDLCLFITIFNFILNYVPIVTFWIFTYHKIWILLIIFCFIWNYWIIYFFNMFGSVLECCELTGVSLLWPWLIKWK